MKRALHISIFALLFFIAPLCHAQSQLELRYEECRDAYQKLVGSNKKKMRHNWVRVIKCFEGLGMLESTDQRVIDSLFTLGMLYSHLYTYSSLDSDLNNALRYYDAVTMRFPQSNLSDDALYKKAKIYNDKRQDYTKAYIELTELLEKYPKSDSSAKAKVLMAKVKENSEGKIFVEKSGNVVASEKN